MVEPLGIGLVEQLLVDTMDEIGAVPQQPFQKSARIATALRDRHGVHLDQGYDALIDLAADWLIPLPLVEPHGNLGSPDFSAASFLYTEARLTPAGLLASRRRETPRLPIALVNGDVHAAGHRPAFSPAGVVDAVSLANREPACSDDELVALVGPPIAATGVAVDGDLEALRAGEPARLRYSSTIAVEAGALVLTALPPGIGGAHVLPSLMARIKPPIPDGQLRAEVSLPITGINDESSRGVTRIVLACAPGTDLDRMQERLLDVWPVSVDVLAHLPAPLATLVRAEVDPDREAQIDALGDLRSLLGDDAAPVG